MQQLVKSRNFSRIKRSSSSTHVPSQRDRWSHTETHSLWLHFRQNMCCCPSLPQYLQVARWRPVKWETACIYKQLWPLGALFKSVFSHSRRSPRVPHHSLGICSGLQRLALQMTPRWNQQPLYFLNDSYHHVIYSLHCRGLLKTVTAASSQVFRAPVSAQTSAEPQLSISCRKKRFVFPFMIIRLKMRPLEGVTLATMIDTECKFNTKAITTAPASDPRRWQSCRSAMLFVLRRT